MSMTVDKLYEKVREYNSKAEIYKNLAEDMIRLAKEIEELENE